MNHYLGNGYIKQKYSQEIDSLMIRIEGNAEYNWDNTSTTVISNINSGTGSNLTVPQASFKVTKVTTDLHPQIYFKYIKSKFGILEGMRMNSRINRLTKAFNTAVNNGQEAMAEKFLVEVARETRESVLYAKGYKLFIEREHLTKYKNKIRGGHISDTVLKEFTRVIPDDVVTKKKKAEPYFDGFVVYHYWNETAEKTRAGEQKMSETEKSKMRDPVLFGIIKESDRLYYIADWEDDFCDLTFDEMVDKLGLKDEEVTIPRDPDITI